MMELCGWLQEIPSSMSWLPFLAKICRQGDPLQACRFSQMMNGQRYLRILVHFPVHLSLRILCTSHDHGNRRMNPSPYIRRGHHWDWIGHQSPTIQPASKQCRCNDDGGDYVLTIATCESAGRFVRLPCPESRPCRKCAGMNWQ
jgi:hypothetical protein